MSGAHLKLCQVVACFLKIFLVECLHDFRFEDIIIMFTFFHIVYSYIYRERKERSAGEPQSERKRAQRSKRARAKLSDETS